jgi:carbon-monoxide dehydrogenase small subunit
VTLRRSIKLEVNRDAVEVEVEPRETLLETLRTQLGLTGAHAGCEQGSCGSCTVLLDNETVRTCLLLTVQCGGRSVTTIEALGAPGALHPVQAALQRNSGLQCGFCTPGIVMTAVDLLARNPSPDEAEVRTALAGNLCRCTGYTGIVDAVLEVAREP